MIIIQIHVFNIFHLADSFAFLLYREEVLKFAPNL